MQTNEITDGKNLVSFFDHFIISTQKVTIAQAIKNGNKIVKLDDEELVYKTHVVPLATYPVGHVERHLEE